MRKIKIIMKIVMLCLILLPGVANALPSSNKDNDKINFFDIKAGVVQPTTLKGNTDLRGSTPDTTYAAGIAVGRKFQKQFAVDLEYMYGGKNNINNNQSNGLANTKWSSRADTLMLNLTADLIEEKSIFIPYLKCGLGFSKNKAYRYVIVDSSDSTNIVTNAWNGKSNNSLAWQIGAGFNFKTSTMFDTQVQYMYTDHGKIKTQNTYNVTYSNTAMPSKSNVASTSRTGKLQDHVVTFGLRFKF